MSQIVLPNFWRICCNHNLLRSNQPSCYGYTKLVNLKIRGIIFVAIDKNDLNRLKIDV